MAEIQRANSILLHCHPSPDPDSVGSALAMKFALEQMGKKATVIRGDSPIPEGYALFPGIDSIIQKNFGEVDLNSFDLFISVDAANREQITRYSELEFPLSIRTIVIDHHRTNPGYGAVNLVTSEYPATAQIIFYLFKIWSVKLDHDIATNLFIGIYTDTGGFKFEGTDSRTLQAAAELSALAKDFPKVISIMENSFTPQDISFQGVALDNTKSILNGAAGLSVVSYEQLKSKNIEPKYVRAGSISSILNSVKNWLFVGAVLEAESGKVRISFRSKDANRFDVAKLAEAIGGGGHRAAAGAVVTGKSVAEVEGMVVSKAKELYNL
ncbi:MAG: bifunctional oligoribonuclease/PAP phosphatase NrnA [Patescibacteria group bacterium]|nr:bifunctional oligoribonuclease/PAP phosphatase NrnA [Patescibacteria group bacterium]